MMLVLNIMQIKLPTAQDTDTQKAIRAGVGGVYTMVYIAESKTIWLQQQLTTEAGSRKHRVELRMYPEQQANSEEYIVR